MEEMSPKRTKSAVEEPHKSGLKRDGVYNFQDKGTTKYVVKYSGADEL